MIKTTDLLRSLFLASALALAATACSDDDVGAECSSKDDCGDGQECVPIAFGCADSGSCASTCEVTCVDDEDCGSDEICANRNGNEICRSTDIDDPSE